MSEQDGARFPAKATVDATTAEHLCDFWVLRGPGNRTVTCGVYRVANGLELRTSYGENETIAAQLFTGPDVNERVAATADEWRVNLIAQRFNETKR